MKFFIVLSVALFASANAGLVGYGAGIVNTGASAVSRSDDGLGNYAFGYNEDHASGGTFRKEQGGPGVQVGSYGLRDADGRVRVVNYVADALGYRASISTNEPGVDPHQAPAATSVNGAVAVAPAVVAAPIASYAAPIASYAAPIAVAAPLASSYSVATQHASVAPVVGAYGAYGYGAPVVGAYGAPIAAAPFGLAGKSYIY